MTPMLQQYADIKTHYSEEILFFRLGDFYELFFEDAKKAAPILGVALTKRGYTNADPIPMCGVPYHASEIYIGKLLKAGLKVAICDQVESVESAKKRGHGAIVKRDVVRVVTPGTVIEEGFISSDQNNYLAALHAVKEGWALSCCDLSTGKFCVSRCVKADVEDLIGRVRPKEILLSSDVAQSDDLIRFLRALGCHITIQPNMFFAKSTAEEALKNSLQVTELEGLGEFSEEELCAAGVVAKYIKAVYKNQNVQMALLERNERKDGLYMDAVTIMSLELLHTQHGHKEGALVSHINATKTASGSRLLVQRLLKPWKCLNLINKQLSRVEFFIKAQALCANFREELSSLGDVERTLTRISMGKFSPKDVGSVYAFLMASEKCSQLSQELPENLFCEEKQYFLNTPMPLTSLLRRALVSDLPMSVQEGGVIERGFDEALDEMRGRKEVVRQQLKCLEQDYIRDTGIAGLRIKENKNAQLYIEVSKRQVSDLPSLFVQTQTLTNSVRLTTAELQNLQSSVQNVDFEVLQKELEIFYFVVEKVLQHKDVILGLSRVLAEIDVAIAQAYIAKENNYCKPSMTEEPILSVDAGWHPVVGAMMPSSQKFVANNCELSIGGMLMITGPNMGGKSTYLRQNALIILLAHMGGFVPAKSAEIGLCDRLFSRVGASDDVTRGRSTFMVEMLETSVILNRATEKSFVILDEVGRGTSTHDGMALARAIAEHLTSCIKARTLFATHYHELAALEGMQKSVKNVHASVQEWEDSLVFEYRVAPGSAHKSYGIQVAKQACMPPSVTNRAEVLLQQSDTALDRVLEACAPVSVKEKDTLRDWAKALDLNAMTPKEALDVLFELQDRMKRPN